MKDLRQSEVYVLLRFRSKLRPCIRVYKVLAIFPEEEKIAIEGGYRFSFSSVLSWLDLASASFAEARIQRFREKQHEQEKEFLQIMSQPRSKRGTFAVQGTQPLDHTRPIKFSLTGLERDKLEALAQKAGVSVNGFAKSILEKTMTQYSTNGRELEKWETDPQAFMKRGNISADSYNGKVILKLSTDEFAQLAAMVDPKQDRLIHVSRNGFSVIHDNVLPATPTPFRFT